VGRLLLVLLRFIDPKIRPGSSIRQRSAFGCRWIFTSRQRTCRAAFALCAFWHKVLYDLGVVQYAGAVQEAGASRDCAGRRQPEDVEIPRHVVNPDEIMDQFGADAVRLYEMFMGPLEAVKPWSKGV